MDKIKENNLCNLNLIWSLKAFLYNSIKTRKEIKKVKEPKIKVKTFSEYNRKCFNIK